MNDRIKSFMDHNGLTSSELADTIGVQRSNVTHVLHGRNKPSFQFIAKLLETYPEIDAKWLIMGEGEMLTSVKKQQTTLFHEPDVARNVAETKPEIATKQMRENVTDHVIATDPKILKDVTFEKEKEIERIVVFYTDQTFKEYIPSK